MFENIDTFETVGIDGWTWRIESMSLYDDVGFMTIVCGEIVMFERKAGIVAPTTLSDLLTV